MTLAISEGMRTMSKGLVACVLMGTLITAPVFGSQTAPLTLRDPRIKHIPYFENSIYRLDLYLKSVSVVQFADNEEVESILIGDSASWEVVKLKNGHVISIKATIPSATTNMTVYTDQRVYTFELHSLGDYVAGRGAPPLFRSVFAYPPAKKPRSGNSARALPERIDSNYVVAGKAEFRPVWVQDNGRQTSFFLPEGAPRPAIFKVGSNKDEQLINSRTLGSRIVVDGVSDYWVLRIGNQTICIARGPAATANPRVRVERGGAHAG